MSEMGIVIQIIIVARQRPKKQNTTNITNNNAYNTVSTSESMVRVMFSDELTIMSSLTSEGRRFCKSGSISNILFEISTELAPDCFWITIMAPLLPLVTVF